ncbi:unnamed protein product, partial [Allacma fusca]
MSLNSQSSFLRLITSMSQRIIPSNDVFLRMYIQVSIQGRTHPRNIRWLNSHSTGSPPGKNYTRPFAQLQPCTEVNTRGHI